MDQATLSSILDAGGIAALASFLIWLNAKNQNRFDEMAESYRQTIRDQESAHAAAEELIRNRYDAVIERHEVQRQAIYDSVAKKIDEQSTLIRDLISKIEG